MIMAIREMVPKARASYLNYPLNPTMPSHTRRLILASTSPYRRELLKRLLVPFECIAPGVSEDALPHETSARLATRLARLKAEAVAALHQDALVIGSDQVLDCNGESMGKPGDHASAARQLATLSGKSVQFHTAVCVLDGSNGRSAEGVARVDVRFRELTKTSIEQYLALESVSDCAGSAKAEGLGIALLASVASSDPTALIGLPLIMLTDLLNQLNYRVLDAAGAR
jgi:septum formation protein